MSQSFNFTPKFKKYILRGSENWYSVIIFHQGRSWKAKFFILSNGIFLIGYSEIWNRSLLGVKGFIFSILCSWVASRCEGTANVIFSVLYYWYSSLSQLLCFVCRARSAQKGPLGSLCWSAVKLMLLDKKYSVFVDTPDKADFTGSTCSTVQWYALVKVTVVECSSAGPPWIGTNSTNAFTCCEGAMAHSSQ